MSPNRLPGAGFGSRNSARWPDVKVCLRHPRLRSKPPHFVVGPPRLVVRVPLWSVGDRAESWEVPSAAHNLRFVSFLDNPDRSWIAIVRTGTAVAYQCRVESTLRETIKATCGANPRILSHNASTAALIAENSREQLNPGGLYNDAVFDRPTEIRKYRPENPLSDINNKGTQKMNVTKLFCGLAAIAGFTLIGCAVDEGDIQASRENVLEERRETEETRREVAENIHEEEAETAEAYRREAMKPIMSDEVQEEAAETEQARREGAEEIAEEEKETREAEQELKKTEAEFSAQQARDAFVKQVEARLEQADKRIEALEEMASDQEGAAKTETESRLNVLETHRDNVKNQLDELKAEDLEKWETHRELVQQSLDELNSELDEPK